MQVLTIEGSMTAALVNKSMVKPNGMAVAHSMRAQTEVRSG